MKRASDFARAAQSTVTSKMPPSVKLDRILSAAEKIQNLVSATSKQKQDSLAICWDAYAKIVAKMHSSDDETWQESHRIASSWQKPFDYIDADRAAVLLYGHADDDGRD